MTQCSDKGSGGLRLKVASMGPMQVDLELDEPLQPTIYAVDDIESPDEVRPVQEVKKESLQEDFVDEESFLGLERLIRFLEKKKRRRRESHQSKRSQAIDAYEKALFMEEEGEVKGMRFDKAG